MTCTLIVLAHPEPTSFNRAWAEATAHTSLALGHEVLWSDLCGMNFDPAEKPAHYAGLEHATPFDVLKVQEAAAISDTLPTDVSGEVEKIRKADRIIFHFPIWWFAPPAILKGWCDRVLAQGALHDVDNRFDRGMCLGKTALFCATAGAQAAECAHNGKEGDAEMLLWPLAYTLRYLGFSVLKPKILFGVHSYNTGPDLTALQTRLAAEIEAHGQTISAFETRRRMQFNPDQDFDDNGTLKPGATSHSPFIRHTP